LADRNPEVYERRIHGHRATGAIGFRLEPIRVRGLLAHMKTEDEILVDKVSDELYERIGDASIFSLP
jgi:hypothetical protein